MKKRILVFIILAVCNQNLFSQKPFEGFEGFYSDSGYSNLIVKTLKDYIKNDSAFRETNPDDIWICMDGLPRLFPTDSFSTATFFRKDNQWKKYFKKKRSGYIAEAELIDDKIEITVSSCIIINQTKEWKITKCLYGKYDYEYSNNNKSWALSSRIKAPYDETVEYNVPNELNRVLMESLKDYIKYTDSLLQHSINQNNTELWICKDGLPESFPKESINNAVYFSVTSLYKDYFKDSHSVYYISVDLVEDLIKIIIQTGSVKYNNGLFAKVKWRVSIASLGKYYYKYNQKHCKWLLFAKQYPH